MDFSTQTDAIDVVSRAVDRITRYGRFAEFELTNGIVLEMRPVPPLLLQAVNNEFKEPEVPKVHIEEDDRWEENPNDPTYLAEIKRLSDAQDLALNNLILAVGTKVKHVPEGYFGPEEDGWIEGVRFASKVSGTEISLDELEDPIKRYLYWLRFYALESNIDIALIGSIPMQLAGIREGEVEEVVESFRSLPGPGADSQSAVEAGSQNGHSTNRATRRTSARNRGT